MTAVEWLHEKLAKSELEDMQTNINLWFKQAKEMEKQQIIDSYASGYIDGVAQNKITAEQYYNETFKKE
jgi:hypothetical protein